MLGAFSFDQVRGESRESGSKDIIGTARGFEKFYILYAALEHRIFDALLDPKTSSTLADERGLHGDMSEKLCRALTSMALLTKHEEKYMLNDISLKYLTVSSPYYQGNLIKLLKKTCEERWSNLSNALINGPTEIAIDQTVFDKSFILAMAEAAVCGSLQETAKTLLKNEDFMKGKKVLDLGGGHGLYSIAFSQINPNFEVSVFDYPQVIEGITREMVLKHSDKINVISGDMTRDSIGSGYDAVFVSDVLYRPEASLMPLLQKINMSLNNGGLLISKHYHLDDLHADQVAVFFDLMFSISGGLGLVHPSEKFCDHITNSGFSIDHVEDIGHPSKIIIAKKVIK